jgi:hypothetical protein
MITLLGSDGLALVVLLTCGVGGPLRRGLVFVVVTN